MDRKETVLSIWISFEWLSEVF